MMFGLDEIYKVLVRFGVDMGDQSEAIQCPECNSLECIIRTKENDHLDVFCADCEHLTMMVMPLMSDQRMEQVVGKPAE